ncbi:hypothetical protein [Hoylesella enoeca]|uniref:hypothetical protein n=1 Tax=Hoylesella enoeca TaxID=76123 RepID=UPI000A570B7B|nr:hypothetical protein [Hoylesella enoeca]
MKKKESLVGYEKPECSIIELETECFICGSPKVTPGGTSFQEDDWEDKGDIDAGEFETE